MHEAYLGGPSTDILQAIRDPSSLWRDVGIPSLACGEILSSAGDEVRSRALCRGA